MKKQVSPVFAAIVIIVVLALGILYFMSRYRAHEARWHQEAAAMRVQADRAQAMRRERGDTPSFLTRRGEPGAVPSGDSGEAPGGTAAGSAATRPGE